MQNISFSIKRKMILRGHFGWLFSIKELASVEQMDVDKLVRCPKMVINDPGLSGSDKAFEVFVKPLQIYFSVLLAYTVGRFIPVQKP